MAWGEDDFLEMVGGDRLEGLLDVLLELLDVSPVTMNRLGKGLAGPVGWG